MFPMILRRSLLTASCLLAASAALAAPNLHIRGQVTAITGDTATVETTSNETVAIKLDPKFGMIVYKPIPIDAVKPGDYLSIPSVTNAAGAKQALAINVFPEALRGAGEGVSPWDLGTDSLMTNATVGTLAAQGADHTIGVIYKGTEETITVPEGTPITRFAPDPDRKLAVGDKAVFFATETDGTVSALRAGVTEDGALPPI